MEDSTLAVNVLASEKYRSISEIDLSQAERFLQFLDPRANQFCFRAYGDKDKSNPHLRCKLEGSFKQHVQTLVAKNNLGASICVVVNDGGHTDNEIKNVRFVFADTDGAPAKPLVNALPPHAIIQSSHERFHIYWRVKNITVSDFASIQKQIAQKYNTDPSISNPSRIMRIPGFLHHKGDPYLTHTCFMDADLTAYSAREIATGLGLELNQCKQIEAGQKIQNDASVSLKEVERCLAYLNPFEPYSVWFKVVHLLADYYGEEGRDLCVRWSRGDLWRGQTDAR